MHFFLFGASGRTGGHVLSHLLSQGHTATALVRKETSLAPRSGLTIIVGSPLDAPDVRKTLAAFDKTSSPSTSCAAIITLNTNRASDSPFAAQISPPRFLADSCATICAALAEKAISRVVIMSTAGVGDSWCNLPWLSRAFMSWTNIKYALKDHNLVDEEIRATKLDWTLVRAVRLDYDDKSQKKVQVLSGDGKSMTMSDSIGIASVAKFLVEVAVEGRFVREAVVVRR